MARTPAILIAHYFYPSAEIGARRATAIAQYLSSHDFPIAVVSAFDGKEENSLSSSLSSIQPVQVIQPKKFLLKGLINLKRTVKNLRQRNENPQESSSNPLPAAESEPKNSARGGSLGGAIVQLAEIVDSYKLWSLRTAKAAVKAGESNQARLVITTAPPMSSLLAGVWTSKRLKAPLIADLRDPWVTGSVAYDPSSFIFKFYSFLERLVIRHASAVTVTSNGLARELSIRYPEAREKIHVIRNGFDGEVLRSTDTTDHHMNVLFAGEIYFNRNPFPFLEALERLVSRPDVDMSRISVTFVGKCSMYRGQLISEWLRNKKSEAIVKILPPVSKESVAKMIQESTVLLNLAQGFRIQIPAKLYEHAASGREVLILSEHDSDIASLVHGIDGIHCVDPGTTNLLDKVLQDIYRRHVTGGKLTAPSESQAEIFSRASQNKKFLKVAETFRLD